MSPAWPSRRGTAAALAAAVFLAAPSHAGEKSGRLDRIVTASISQLASFAGEAGPADMERLKAGLDALAGGDVDAARAARDALVPGSLDRHILTWAIAVRGGSRIPSAEIAAAARELPGWPEMATLRRNSERALFRENPPPQAVLATFGTTPPQTAEGATILARAYLATGDRDGARKMLGAFWRGKTLAPDEEAAILAEFGDLIDRADHRFRMEKLLYGERVLQAQKLAGPAGAEALQKAWAAVLRGDQNAGKLLIAVPAEQRSAGFVFAQARQLRRANDLAGAAALMAGAPKDAATLVDPDAWWAERRVLARALMDAGDARRAYQVAAVQAAGSTVSTIDAAFHAGWYALRALGDAKLAAGHFSRIAELAEGPISRSRAYYWLGRAAEAGGPGDAAACYAKAAQYGTTFYGQLAAQKLGRAALDLPYPEPSGADRENFSRREAVRAIDRLEQAGHADISDRLYRDLAGQLSSPGELALLAGRAESRGNHFLALRIGKIAVGRGIDIGALSHPVGAIPAEADISSAGKALAYAVARQESEFNVGAVSGAGARGLLQLLPGTAKDQAKRVGLPYSQQRLTTDPGYNATLGAAFLAQQLGRFDGSYVLTFAGYNAGPGRAKEWIQRYGDPRGMDLDGVIDWIERIPFTETRSYVQRVMENYQVYKMRLTGKFDIAGDLVKGRS
ncbi:MAG: lytic transglycosylase domain-containing protein [Rhizobiales bacterium]|nr:lytic transglycosylase domain-containing protein [Hyphomicrobiales bacterium]